MKKGKAKAKVPSTPSEWQAQSPFPKPKKAEVKRIESGIPGFDGLIEGGLPAGSVAILSGHSGTGRSTFAMQFLVHGAKNGEPGVYVTLERETEEVLETFSDFGWGLDGLLAQKKLAVLKPDLRRFDTLRQTIEEEVDRLQAKRLVIDPFSLLSAYFNNVYDVRKALSDLSRQMRASGCTLLALTDIKENETGFSSTGFEEFVAGGIISLDLLYKKESGELVRTLLVRKMARTRHALRPVPFEITKKGVELHPDAEVF